MPCHRFVNTSVDKICEKHKQEALGKKLAKLSNRVGVRSEGIDVNAIRAKAREAVNDGVGAFGGFRGNNRPKASLTVE